MNKDKNNISSTIDNYVYVMDTAKIPGNMIDHIEELVITKLLERLNGNQAATAKALGLHRNTVHNKIKKFKIDVGRFKK